MPKIMLFIDGSWLYSNMTRLSETYGDPGYKIDYGKLPGVLSAKVAESLGGGELDVVRSYLFGSYPANYDNRDEDGASRQRDFYDMLKEVYHYEVELYPTNLRGRRLRKADRDPDDPFEAKEKCVDIALATTMLYLAAIPYAYDIAIVVVGDRDFVPMLQNVRRLGKRVAVASIHGSCAPDLADPRDPKRIKDFDIIWMDEILADLELKFERHQLECQSPLHQGDRHVWTTFHPRPGQYFYCDACRESNRKRREDAWHESRMPSDESEPAPAMPGCDGDDVELGGIVKRLLREKHYGFILGDNHGEYFFHESDLADATYDELEVGCRVAFEIKSGPQNGHAAAAQYVSVERAEEDTDCTL